MSNTRSTHASSQLSTADYLAMDATAMAAAVSLNKVEPAELLACALARCDAVDGLVGAVNMRHDQHARERVERLGRSPLQQTGLLAGVPMLIKDLNTYLAGTPTSNGSRFLSGDTGASHTSTVVQRYEDAGMVIFGKTATPEFGLATTTESALWGPTHNPWNLSRSAGGSSGGAAAAVAAGIVPVAHATDGGGSIRIPASYCGVFGLKPTRYRTPQGPSTFEGWFGASCGHVVSRTVRDSALILDATHGREHGSPYWLKAMPLSFVESQQRDPVGLRVGLLTTSMTGAPLDAEIAAILSRTAQLMEQMGHHVEPATLKIDPTALFTAHGVASGAALVTAIRDREATLGREATPDDLEAITHHIYQRNKAVTSESLYRARLTFDQIALSMDTLMLGYDVLLSPVTASQTPPLGELTLDQPFASYAQKMIGSAAFTVVANVSGQPSMSVPSGFTADGMPVGMMFTAALGREDILFSVAGQLERARPWTLPPEGWAREADGIAVATSLRIA
ncbi:amidase [Paraburkholderia sp.]|uniref:amidase n=1 Tax=Paraburkholderia sp. TaxID=1926495 RepID=UPI002392B776|nr:amidase [Paraburkholderia sp.]MDE1179325.1 amidase [Paraburkholderia sp.]